MATCKKENSLKRVKENKKIIARDRDHLKELVDQRIKEFGPRCSLNDIDVSQVTDMSKLFLDSKFDGDISEWDVSNVTIMYGMFSNSYFNNDISQWNVSGITYTYRMFKNSPLEGNEPDWYFNVYK